MARRKRIDLQPVVDALLGELDERILRSVRVALHDMELRLDRLERAVAGKRGRVPAEQGRKSCRKAGCGGSVVAHRLCSRHYQQWRYHLKKQSLTQAAATGHAEHTSPAQLAAVTARDRRSVSLSKRALLRDVTAN